MNSNGFQQSAYNKYTNSNINPSDVDIGSDVIKAGNLFMSDPKKHEDLKVLLESNKDSAKLDAMKRIITMVAKGKDCADLFPSVVKNVVSKNAEVKKLVYAYLTRYAEEKQDLALLSISTFQRALKDPNQLIRGSALRVLSSIRVPMIVPIMMLAIKESVNDMSPYVRKIAAHAIPKMYSLDAGSKEQLIEVIEKLLADKTTLVAGSAIQAFEEVCPERLDLIHKHYRKLCSLLIDVEEWGQVVIINMLTRYARTQFVDPNLVEIIEVAKKFYSDEDNSSNSDSDGDKQQETSKAKLMDSDHRLLLHSARPLLHSRNSAVVMSVVQLFYHCAPKSEMNVVIMSLVRLLKCNKEVQYVVLNNIATMSITQPELFQGNLKSFYVYNSEPTQVKLLKLEILTNLANENNISVILRELQSYVGNTDQEFVTATIQAIGRCASNIADVSDNCLSGLVQLISRKDENIVAEAIVVIRKLLQMQTSDHRDIIVSMALLLDTINVPMAKASIIWLIGEYCDRVPKLAPDVLRKAAKSFIDEKDIVKLQTINLAAKLFITNPKQSRLLTQYVLNLAKYDMNYDIRDRGRFIRALLFPQAQDNNKDDSQNTSLSASFLSKRIKKIFLATKPAPLLHSNYKDRHQYQLGTLSHILNHRVNGYNDLPNWPEVAPDPSLRVVKEVDESFYNTGSLLVNPSNLHKKKKHLNEDSVSSSESSESSSDDSKDSSVKGDVKDETATEDSSESSSDTEDEETDEEIPAQISSSKKDLPDKLNDKNINDKIKKAAKNEVQNKFESKKTGSHDDSSNSESSTTDATDSDASSDYKTPVVISKKKVPVKPAESKPQKSKAPEIDLLLDFDEPIGVSKVKVKENKNSVMSSNFSKATPISSMPLTPSFMDKIISTDSNLPTAKSIYDDFYIPTDIPIKSIELLSKFNSRLVSIDCQFTRSLSVLMNHPKYISVNLLVTNISKETLHNVRILRELSSSNIDSSSHIDTLLPGKTLGLLLAIDFKDCSQPVMLTVGFYTLIESNVTDLNDSTPRTREQEKQVELKIKSPIGELFQPINMTEKEFLQYQNKLRGMNEFTNSFPVVSSTLTVKDFIKRISQAVYSVSNITTVSNNRDDSGIILRYAGCSCSSQLPCLIEITVKYNANTIGDSVCNIKVNSEQITLVSQLLKEFTDAIKLAVNV